MKSCEELYSAVQPMIDSGDLAAAINEIQTLLSLYPGFAQGQYELGALYVATGEKEKAFGHFQDAARLEPHNPIFLKALADHFYLENNDIEEAKALYLKVVVQDPQHVECLQILGNLAVVERDFKKAKEYYNQVLDLEPWNNDVLMILEKLDQHKGETAIDQPGNSSYEQSQRLVQAGEIDAAINVLEALIAEQPDFALAHNDLGVLYYQAGRKEKTLECYEEAVRLDPSQMNFQKNLAEFYFVELGRVEDALTIYHRLLNMDPTDIETLMATGYICKALKRNEDAIVFFERILDIEPWNLEASDNLDQLNLMTTDSI